MSMLSAKKEMKTKNRKLVKWMKSNKGLVLWEAKNKGLNTLLLTECAADFFLKNCFQVQMIGTFLLWFWWLVGHRCVSVLRLSYKCLFGQVACLF